MLAFARPPLSRIRLFAESTRHVPYDDDLLQPHARGCHTCDIRFKRLHIRCSSDLQPPSRSQQLRLLRFSVCVTMQDHRPNAVFRARLAKY